MGFGVYLGHISIPHSNHLGSQIGKHNSRGAFLGSLVGEMKLPLLMYFGFILSNELQQDHPQRMLILVLTSLAEHSDPGSTRIAGKPM